MKDWDETLEAERNALLEKIRKEKNPSTKGIVLCGRAMGEMLILGWPKSSLDSLEILWWSMHDGNGNLITK